MNQEIVTDLSGLVLTDHAVRRTQQRGIKAETLKFVIQNSDLLLHAGEGTLSMRISNRQIVKLGEEGIKPSMLERAKNIVIIFDPSNTMVVSILLDHGSKSGRSYRSQCSTRSRKRRQQRQQMARHH